MPTPDVSMAITAALRRVPISDKRCVKMPSSSEQTGADLRLSYIHITDRGRI